MKIGKSDEWCSNFEVNGRRIVMSRNGVNGAARPIKNCSRQDVYEAMADIYNEFYFNEIDTDRMIPIDWIKKYIENNTVDTIDPKYDGWYFTEEPIDYRITFYPWQVVEMLNKWEKENETD